MPLDLFDKQRICIRDGTQRLNILDGAVRSGKSFVSLLAFADYVLRTPKNSQFFLCGVTNASIDRNVVTPLQEFFGNSIYYIRSRGVAEFFGRKMIMFGGGAEASLRGSEFQGGYFDEVVLCRESFWSMALSRLSRPNARLYASTNPDNPSHWFKKKYIDRRRELDMFYQHYIIDDNTKLDKAYVKSLKKEYTGLFYRRYIMGEWVAGEGAVYDFFDSSLSAGYVIKNPPKKADEYWIACDYGTQNPTVFLLMGRLYRPVLFRNKQLKCWAENEYYYCGRSAGRQKTDYEYYEDLKNFIARSQRNIRGVIVDPSAQSFVALLRKNGINVRLADNSVMDGIRRQTAMLSSGEYRVCACCAETINEYFGYRWDAKIANRGEDKPIKESDHTKDAERYFINTIYGGTAIDYAGFTNN